MAVGLTPRSHAIHKVMVHNGCMNFILVGLTFVILAAVLISCAVLGADRLSGAEYVSRDGIDCPGPETGPLESDQRSSGTDGAAAHRSSR